MERWRLIVIVGLLALGVFFSASSVGERVYDRARLALAPSASRAYEIGNKYFDAHHAVAYDIDRAEYFFLQAEKLDSKYPYLQHQLARVAFLKGNFKTALQHIDKEIEVFGTTHANAYYVRGLIKGYAGDYAGAAKDYESYLRTDSKNWAAINDYAWVLIKAKRYRDALIALDWGLIFWPENAWLHNSRATALFELGRGEMAYDAVIRAYQTVANLTGAAWLQAYPGNDPMIAGQGIAAFQDAVRANLRTIGDAVSKASSQNR